MSNRQILSQNSLLTVKRTKHKKKKKKSKIKLIRRHRRGVAGQKKLSLVLDIPAKCAGPAGWVGRGGGGVSIKSPAFENNKTNKKKTQQSTWGSTLPTNTQPFG